MVGEQIRTVFNADIAYVALYNPHTGIIDFPYQYGDELGPLAHELDGLRGRFSELQSELQARDSRLQRPPPWDVNLSGKMAAQPRLK
jgi:hypothetical protein